MYGVDLWVCCISCGGCGFLLDLLLYCCQVVIGVGMCGGIVVVYLYLFWNDCLLLFVGLFGDDEIEGVVWFQFYMQVVQYQFFVYDLCMYEVMVELLQLLYCWDGLCFV